MKWLQRSSINFYFAAHVFKVSKDLVRRLFCLVLLATTLRLSAANFPVIYSTDLFHPHDDPDDHFDLATLFALPELDVRAILLDQGDRQAQRPGAVPLKQMLHIANRQVPFAVGLGRKLASPTDDGSSQPAEYQAGIDLLLKTLRESPQPVTIITAGSVRDVCAAWNREPALMQKQVLRIYVNIGNANDGQTEYNVDLDPQAYIGLLRSRLPIYLCFCLPMRNEGSNAVYSTWWRFRQSEVLESAPEQLQRFFIYALQRPSPAELDPLKALETDLRPWRRLVWEMDRNMWCTASFLDAAGRSVQKLNGTWTCSRPKPEGEASESVFTFVPARVEVDDAGRTKMRAGATDANVRVFKVTAPEAYSVAMRDCLRELLSATNATWTGAQVDSSWKVISRGESSGTYQAFPDICRLTNGDLFCVFYAGYAHVSLPRGDWPNGGRICWVRSSDEGRNWSAPRVLFDGASDDRDPHIAQMRDGTLLCSFFTYRPQAEGKVQCDTCLVASRDGGATWDTEPQVVASGWPESAPVRELPDGTRLLGVYHEDGPTAYGGVIRWAQDSRTWSAPIPIGKDSGVRLDAETDLVPLKDGTLYAALRGDRVNMHFATSSDSGRTWSAVKDIGFPAHCPHFTRLNTGEILLAHRLPLTSIHISRDEARTWQGPYQIDDKVGAYPSTVELRDGTVLIVYYEEGSGSAIRARRFRVKPEGIEFLKF